MAIQKSVEVLGFETTNYVKIHSTSTQETGSDENGKLYEVTVGVNFYTNASKEHIYNSQNFRLQGLRESDLMLSTLYSLLLSASDFDGYTND